MGSEEEGAVSTEATLACVVVAGIPVSRVLRGSERCKINDTRDRMRYQG